MIKKFTSYIPITVLVCCLITSIHANDEIDASYDPPGGLAPQKVPLFVNIGFDDNMYPDGMTWLLDFIEDKKNPEGFGNPATFDGQPIKVSFYFVSSFMEDVGDPLIDTWKRAKQAGHEVACHTHTHSDLGSASTSTWLEEMNTCNGLLADKLQVAEEEIWGFRVPYLAYNSNAYSALEQNGLLYDCTIMHMPEPYDNVFLWPYTLHNELHPSTQTSVGKHPGVWEIPCYNILMHPSGYPHMCGFDDSIFRRANSAEQFLDMMKWSLDIRLQDGKNRAPMTLGAHTDVYSPTNPNDELYETLSTSDCERRRWAIEEFIKYALSKPDVRIVTAKQIIQWMRNPVALDDVSYVTDEKVNSTNHPFTITVLTPAMISVSVTRPGYYSLILYSAQGRQLGKAKYHYLHLGQNRITFSNSTLTRGTCIVEVSGQGISRSKKLIFYGR